jgi:selenocysteine lyase/cysteine desulfurase
MEHLERLKAYKVRPASDEPPGKFETGTQNHEGMAGVLGVIEYLEWLGGTFGGEYLKAYDGGFQGRRLRLKQAMGVIRSYEFELAGMLLDVLEETPGVTTYGLRDRQRLDER